MQFLIYNKTLNKIDKIELLISYALQLSLIAAILFLIYKKHWTNVFLTVLILFLTSLPALIRRNYKVRLPVEMDLIVILFIFAALFLGEVQSYYTTLWWWDILLHFSSGILFGIAGFMLVYILNREEKIPVKMNECFVSIFSVAFAIAIGVFWEIFEFFMDSTFGFNMQKSGLMDTMGDLIVNAAGALAVGILGYFYIAKHKFLFYRKIRSFLEKDPFFLRNN